MELKEFVKLNPDEIRRNKEQMQLYVKFYEAAFSILPNCVGCSFKCGFKKLRSYALNSDKTIKFERKSKTMATNTFKLKSQFILKILTYRKNGKTFRRYGYNLTEEFAIELVKSGQGDLFHTLPSKSEPVNENKEPVKNSFEDMDYRKELLPYYDEVRNRLGKSAVGKGKKAIIEFLIANES